MDEGWIEAAYQERKAWQLEQKAELEVFATALFGPRKAKVQAPEKRAVVKPRRSRIAAASRQGDMFVRLRRSKRNA